MYYVYLSFSRIKLFIMLMAKSRKSSSSSRGGRIKEEGEGDTN